MSMVAKKTKWQCGRGSVVKLKSKIIGPSVGGTDSGRWGGLATSELGRQWQSENLQGEEADWSLL
ncbi:hypothetical protein F2Q70_00038415 [Brassica cretica]|uniref:Uncharacterized protein n=1 Tax=Brassica cretica TaxID=69181 RepID=A0A8S9K6I0_BRACR|nr:hypothetical protein F2Q70_00038415 [Brassica cretica]